MIDPARFFAGHPRALAAYPKVRAPSERAAIALPRRVRSPRFKEIVHPTPKRWLHHLEIASPSDIDREVACWLREAFEHAA